MIETRDIRVDYGDLTAVRDLTVTIPTGEVFGLIGPNGAGKSSLIRVLATLQEPTYGEAYIHGRNIQDEPAEVRRILGYMPDMAPVHDDFLCWEFLDFFARSYFVSRPDRRRRVDECIARVHLQGKRDVPAGTLSRGMKQRLVLAKTLLHDPKILLLDEPASGLDPIARIDMRNLLRDLASDGRTILVSSHILNELSEFCTSVGVMEKGRLVVSGKIDTILRTLNAQRRYVVELLPTRADLRSALAEKAQVTDVEHANGRCEFTFAGTDDEAAALLADLVRGGVPVKAFYERKRGVEDIMLQVGAREVS